ncbi:putative reverse transcriptase domain-containing protein [Tanacetum coccineum]
MKKVFHISNCPPRYQVKYASCTLLDGALTWWNSHKRTVGVDAAYAMTWKALMRLMTEMVPKEEDQVEKYIGGLPDNIQRNVIAAEPTRLQDAICIANNLMDQKLKGYAIKKDENKRRFDNNSRDNHGQQQKPFKRQNVNGQNMAKAYTVGNNVERRGYAGAFPYCNKYRMCHTPPRRKREAQGHYRSECPKLRNQNRRNKTGNKIIGTMQAKRQEAYAIGERRELARIPTSSWNVPISYNRFVLCYLISGAVERTLISSSKPSLPSPGCGSPPNYIITFRIVSRALKHIFGMVTGYGSPHREKALTTLRLMIEDKVIPRFGRPQAIISDNGKQFGKDTFLIFCKKLGTLQASTSVYHPQANMGHVKYTKQRKLSKDGCEDLVYGSEVVIPIEISVETKRVQDFDPKENEKGRREDLDILEERREMASIKKPLQTEAQGRISRKNGTNMGRTLHDKEKHFGYGAYKLETLSGEAVDRTWNGTNLHKGSKQGPERIVEAMEVSSTIAAP